MSTEMAAESMEIVTMAIDKHQATKNYEVIMTSKWSIWSGNVNTHHFKLSVFSMNGFITTYLHIQLLSQYEYDNIFDLMNAHVI